jgi:hypothetical protein
MFTSKIPGTDIGTSSSRQWQALLDVASVGPESPPKAWEAQGDLSLDDHNESSFRMWPSPHTRRTAVPLAVWQDCNRTGRSNRKETALFFR